MVVVIDYGMGNTWSVVSALSYLGVTNKLSNRSEDIEQASHLILPGVGAFPAAMENLRARKLIDPIREAAIVQKKPLLGICLGMQLLAEDSTEEKPSAGLGLVPFGVRRLASASGSYLKIPHIGFNSVVPTTVDSLFEDISSGSDFYFVHSFAISASESQDSQEIRVSTCEYGDVFLASFRNENIAGVQFHPEKSHVNGLKLLKNFLSF